MTKIITRTAATGFLLLVASACSSTSGTADPATSSNAPSTSASSALKAPQVTSPLDVTKYEQDPCSTLTQAQATQVFNAVRNRKISGNAAPICTWNDSNNSSISIGFLPGQGGLETAYKNGADSTGGYFEAAPEIAGYPAVFTGVVDDRKSGRCQMAVGVKTDETFTVSNLLRKSSSSYSDPCSLVTKVAEAAVTTLKAGA